VSAGAILEECTRIVFSSSSQLDVKDFDWLRNGVPSPNYTIEQKIVLDKAVVKFDAIGAREHNVHSIEERPHCSLDESAAAVAPGEAPGDESDGDEL
jgi:hypothetical protein